MPSTFPEAKELLTKPSLLRRLLAILYDTLICVALLICTTGLYKMIHSAIIGETRLKELTEAGALDSDPLLTSILFCTLFFFFGYFWTKTGQTLGMQVWHLRVQNADGTAIRWSQALLRFMAAWISAFALGLGYLWVLWDKDKRGWMDYFSNTHIVRIPKRR